jgi:hypothetical protein
MSEKNTHNDQMAEMKQLITQQLLEALKNTDKPPRASMLGAAISWAKAHGLDNLKTPTEVEQAVEAIRTSYVNLPFGPGGKPNRDFVADAPAPATAPRRVPFGLDDDDDDE